MDKIFTKEFLQKFIAPPRKKIFLKQDFDSAFTPDSISRDDAAELLRQSVDRLAKFQEKLYAQNVHAILIVLQAMDAAGKDSVIRHVMTGLNPQGCDVHSFKSPSDEELDHDFLWRCARALPERGRIGIFNRSYYEEVLVVRVHPELLAHERLSSDLTADRIWHKRFEDINNFEKYLTNNAIHVIKLYLNVSKDEQRKRFLARIEKPEKNWKFSVSDVAERAHWKEYMQAYEDVFQHTSTEYAPWYIVPADHKWVTRLIVASIISSHMAELDLQFPSLNPTQRAGLEKARLLLENE